MTGHKIDISEIVEESLIKLDKSNHHKDREVGVFYPSESLQCQRKIYNHVLHPDVSKKVPYGLFHMAKKAEASIIDLVRLKEGLCVQEQVRIEKEIANNVMLHGYLDFSLIDDDGNTKQIFEIKSTRYLGYISKADSAKLHHRAQLQCYLQTMKCENGSLIYVERDDISHIKQYDETYDDDLWDKIKNHFSEISEAMNEREIPKPVPVEDWECNYCEYKKLCSPIKKLTKKPRKRKVV